MIGKNNAMVTTVLTKKTKAKLLEKAKKDDDTLSKVVKKIIDAYFKQQAE